MKRKPTVTRDIGSLVSGTMRPEDLIPRFASELRHLLKVCRVDRETRKRHVALVNRCNAIDWPAIPEDDDVMGLTDELCEALQHYAPPYCMFGAHQDDGADYGFWPLLRTCDDELPRLEAGLEHRDHWGEDVILANDHGNLSCGRFDKRGRFHEYWSCV